MPRQESDLDRSNPTEADSSHVKAGTDQPPPGDRGELGPIPPGNQPGHHGPDQDKPRRRPPQPRSAAAHDDPAAPNGGTQRFPFLFDPRLFPAAAAVGVLPPIAHVEVDDTDLSIRFGPWSLRTPLTNVRSTEVTGPYQWWKVAGPPHLSLADHGITFATTTESGLCIGFHEPVPALLPRRLLRHPAATVTVAAPHALATALGV